MTRLSRHLSGMVLLKWIGLVPLLLAYFGTSLVASAVPGRDRTRRMRRVRITTFFSRRALRLFGVRLRLHDPHHLRSPRGGCLMIANHLSYIDILALSAVTPLVFITSVELKQTPLLGMLARFGGSLFVERRKRSGLKQEIAEIARVLDQGFSVVLFPEGTTSNGDHVHPFKRSLFDAAIISQSPVLPVCLRYTSINREPVTPGNRDALYYYGGTSFGRHFPNFLSLRSVDLEIFSIKPISISTETTRQNLAESAHDAIRCSYEGEARVRRKS